MTGEPRASRYTARHHPYVTHCTEQRDEAKDEPGNRGSAVARRRTDSLDAAPHHDRGQDENEGERAPCKRPGLRSLTTRGRPGSAHQIDPEDAADQNSPLTRVT